MVLEAVPPKPKPKRCLHEPKPGSYTRRDGAKADLFAYEDYPIFAVCQGCGLDLRADSFLHPFMIAD